jgi:hypothetical protein
MSYFIFFYARSEYILTQCVPSVAFDKTETKDCAEGPDGSTGMSVVRLFTYAWMGVVAAFTLIV